MNDKTLRLICRTLLIILILVSAIFTLTSYFGLSADMSKYEQAEVVGPFLMWTYILAIIGAALALLFPIYDVVLYPKKALKLLASVGGLGVIVLIAYFLADATPLVTATSATNPAFSDRSTLIWTDTGLITCYLLFVIAIVLLVITGVRSALRRY